MNRYLLCLLCVALAACAAAPSQPVPATLAGDAAHPAQAQGWVRTELYFGVGDATGAALNESQQARWQAFMDQEITPRFPDGLSVYDVSGQWRTQGHADIERLRSKEVMLLYADTAQHRQDIDAIRAAWKRLSGDLSVLAVTQPAAVSF